MSFKQNFKPIKNKSMILTVGVHTKTGPVSLRVKSWMIMKLTIASLLFFTFQGNAHSYAQRVTFIKKNVQLTEVFKAIENQTGFLFFYDKAIIQKTDPIDIIIKDATVEEALATCLKDKQLTYTIVKNTIVILQEKTTGSQMRNISMQVSPQPPPPVDITGRVVNKDGAPLQNVSVMIAGTKKGTTTNSDGRFTLTVSNPENIVLEISSVGFENKTVRVGKQTEIYVTLKEENSGLEEVVIVGYGKQKRGDLTGAISTVSAKTIEGQAVSNVNEALQGRVPGAEITAASGEPGAPLQIRIRGMGTFGNTGPLYIVDGVPINVNDINSINPSDISSVNILKDASAAAIYGSRAANGVVLITTKTGQTGKPQVSYNEYYGIQSFTNYIPLLNSQQYADLNNDASANAGKAPEPAFNNPEVLKTNTDWQRAAYPSAPIQNHSLTISGGSEDAKYSVSAGYFDQQGIMVFNYLKRYSARVNTQFKIGKKITVGESINLSRSLGLNQGQGNNLDFTYLLGASPTMHIYRLGNLGGYAGPNAAETGRNNRENIIERRDMRRNYGNQNKILGNLFAEYNILPNLKYRLNLGLNTGLYSSKLYVPKFEADNRSNLVQSLSQNRNESYEYLVEHTLTYDKVFHENYSVSLLAGYTQQNAFYSNMSGSIQQFPSNDLQVIDAGTGTYTLHGNEAEWALRSFLGRANFKLFDKYLFTTTFRRDGSSRFGSKNRYGNFPSFAAGWQINRENFMKNISFINDLKLRASWGKLGNQEIGNYVNQSTVSTAIRYILGIKQEVAPAAAVVSLGNSALKWETTTQTNIGTDLTVLNNHVTFNADYWIKNTDGVLLRTPISAASGISRDNGPYQNAAGIKNSGFEFALQYRENIRDFNFELSGNLSTVKNEVTSLGGLPYIINLVNNAYNYGTFTYTTVGQSMSSFYGYIAEGVFQNSSEIASHATQPGAAPGDIKFKDINGDGVITAEDRTVIGDPFGNFNYGFTASATYKAFDLFMSFRGVQGKQLYNSQRAFLESMDGEHGQMATTLMRWHGEGTSNSMPRAVRGDPNNNARPSTRFVDNASFFKFQSLQIGYTIPAKLTNRLGIKKLRAYINGQNLLTFTDYPNYNPDVLGGSGYSNANNMDPLSIGVDTGTYPIPRVFQFGAVLNF